MTHTLQGKLATLESLDENCREVIDLNEVRGISHSCARFHELQWLEAIDGSRE